MIVIKFDLINKNYMFRLFTEEKVMLLNQVVLNFLNESKSWPPNEIASELANCLKPQTIFGWKNSCETFCQRFPGKKTWPDKWDTCVWWDASKWARQELCRVEHCNSGVSLVGNVWAIFTSFWKLFRGFEIVDLYMFNIALFCNVLATVFFTMTILRQIDMQ